MTRSVQMHKLATSNQDAKINVSIIVSRSIEHFTCGLRVVSTNRMNSHPRDWKIVNKNTIPLWSAFIFQRYFTHRRADRLVACPIRTQQRALISLLAILRVPVTTTHSQIMTDREWVSNCRLPSTFIKRLIFFETDRINHLQLIRGSFMKVVRCTVWSKTMENNLKQKY